MNLSIQGLHCIITMSEKFSLSSFKSSVATFVYFSPLRLGQVIYKGKINEPDDMSLTGCDPNGKLTVLVHGWTQTCEKEVMKILALST